MPKAAFYTLGCKVNQYESAAMAELFENRGYTIVDFDSEADVYIINTCNVTNESARKSRQIIRKAIRSNPAAKIAVVGCYAQTNADEILKIPGVSVILGTKDRQKIVDLLQESDKTDAPVVDIKNVMKDEAFEEIALKGHRQKTRAFLKIEDGCNMFCSYCIIPYTRGPVRSRILNNILNEAENLANEGFKEIVLTGIHLGLYGTDLESKTTLLDVISEIAKIQGIDRIRLSSIEVIELNDEFLLGLSKIDKFCHHFHVPLQSGCDSVLQRMNRRYTTIEFAERVHQIRKLMPDASVTTDVIVGFPGETDEEFEQTKNFIKVINFSKLHVFPFSPRKGTPAAAMTNQVEKDVKSTRCHELLKLSEKLEQNFRNKFLNSSQKVLFEDKTSNGLYEGFTENYIKVAAPSTLNTDLRNKIACVKLKRNLNDCVYGEITEP